MEAVCGKATMKGDEREEEQGQQKNEEETHPKRQRTVTEPSDSNQTEVALAMKSPSAIILFKYDALVALRLDVSGSMTLSPPLYCRYVPNNQSVGYIVADSKVYVIGGAIPDEPDPPRDAWLRIMYIRDVWIYDLCSDNGKWTRGPRLEGAKPQPLLFATNGRIYALAGNFWSTNIALAEIEMPSPAFECLDLSSGSGSWRKLDEPPFRESYKFGFSPKFLFHCVIDDILYVQVRIGRGLSARLYSFDLKTEEWHSHYNPANYPPVVQNMLSCYLVKFTPWIYRQEIFNGKLFVFDVIEKFKLHVFDFTASKQGNLIKMKSGNEIVGDKDGMEKDEVKENVEKDDVMEEVVEDEDEEWVDIDEFVPREDLTPRVVNGLDGFIRAEILGRFPSMDKSDRIGFEGIRGYVFPLDENNNFCLVVHFQPPEEDYQIFICTFTVREECKADSKVLCVGNVTCSHLPFNCSRWGLPAVCGKM